MNTSVILRKLQIFWSFFIGIGAIWGCIMMFTMSYFFGYGETSLLEYMQVLPWPEIFFQSYTFPAISLFMVNCLPNIITLVLLFKKHRLAPLATMICGVILMLWIVIQFVIFPTNFLSITYFIFGFIQAANGLIWMRKTKGN